MYVCICNFITLRKYKNCIVSPVGFLGYYVYHINFTPGSYHNFLVDTFQIMFGFILSYVVASLRGFGSYCLMAIILHSALSLANESAKCNMMGRM